jgi:2-methylcitrate dehydratase PrpD
VTSARAVRTQRSARAFALGLRGGIFTTSIPAPDNTGGTVKRVHCGWAAHCGGAAAGLAWHGLTGPPTVLEGRFGFLQAFCGDRAHPDAVVRGPASGYRAAFSGPCTVAAALLGGGLGVSHEDFTDAAARDPRGLALAALVRCVEDERCSAPSPAVPRVTTRTG